LLLAEFEKLTGAAELMEVEQPFTFRFDDPAGGLPGLGVVHRAHH
jgi:hypothetical protein